ncbi:MAG: 3,4-dihydroxy-2-butanone-4-phosphate synthase [Lutibacter sp.]|uniref:3,4-dihydroxy-2-butanone-4-phosphate synthase n=1 Tax=Lutibacter sp. TaxID=1925666 RepID=UPI0017B946C3|nr:3,4-dihydroxy-2-butanone-4-phosphate synthase [Lutibacter sp.]MBT8316153.1 3,4-dihydroxy-2-butanone-4-phosphate synthase [Lutibacter sp.]NNJ57013.1 3,4-dihydroxy-2-butanone-4-phosphate synthase [Lutibacter sp.]
MNNQTNKIKLNSIVEAIEAIKNGQMIIVVDDEDRENEGDFIAAAECVTPEMINFMSKEGRGLICAPLTEDRCEELDLPLMVNKNTVLHNTQFTVSIDLIGDGCTTGISAYDRAKTIKALTLTNTQPDDFGRPGHIFPLRAKEGGVLRRTGHTEASIDLARLAGFQPAGILVEILNEDGTMARLPQLLEVAKKFDLKIISIEDLVAYRMKYDSLIVKIEDFNVKTRFGEFRLRAYKQTTNNQIHLALTKGSWNEYEEVMVRVNSSLINNDIIRLLTKKPDNTFSRVFKKIEDEGKGAVVFISQENQSFNLVNRLSLLKEAQKEIANKVPNIKPDDKDFGIGAQILHDLEINKLRVLSNSPSVTKRIGMTGYGLEIVEYLNY